MVSQRKMKSLSAVEVPLLVVSTLLLVFCVCVQQATPFPVDDGGANPDLKPKPPCPIEDNGEQPLVNFGEPCEGQGASGTCYKNCSTSGAICIKRMGEHHHHSGSSSDDHDGGQAGHEQPVSNSVDTAACACPEGSELDLDHSHCVKKAAEKSSESGGVSEQAPAQAPAVQTEDKDDSGAMNKPDTSGQEHEDNDHDHDEPNASTGGPGGSGSANSAEGPDEAPKSKSNIGLAVGVITLTMFGMILVFLMRHKINGLFRRMCGGRQQVPQHEN